MKTHELLSKAAVVLGERGWCQHALEDDDGRVCLVGAISYAHNGTSYLTTDGTKGMHWGAAVGVLMDRLGTATLGRWNDTPGRTKEEVIALLKNSAAELATTELLAAIPADFSYNRLLPVVV